MDVPEPLRSSKGLWRRLGRGAVRAASLEAGAQGWMLAAGPQRWAWPWGLCGHGGLPSAPRAARLCGSRQIAARSDPLGGQIGLRSSSIQKVGRGAADFALSAGLH